MKFLFPLVSLSLTFAARAEYLPAKDWMRADLPVLIERSFGHCASLLLRARPESDVSQLARIFNAAPAFRSEENLLRHLTWRGTDPTKQLGAGETHSVTGDIESPLKKFPTSAVLSVQLERNKTFSDGLPFWPKATIKIFVRRPSDIVDRETAKTEFLKVLFPDGHVLGTVAENNIPKRTTYGSERLRPDRPVSLILTIERLPLDENTIVLFKRLVTTVGLLPQGFE